VRLPSALELRIAARYLRSRRGGRGVSLITGIAIGGLAVGVMALIVVLGLMNGLRDDLRDRILVASPHLRILTYGAGLRVEGWQEALVTIRANPGVVAAAPEIITESIITAGADYATTVSVLGVEPDSASLAVTSLPDVLREGDLGFRPTREGVDGAVLLGWRLAERVNARPGDVVSLVPPSAAKVNRALGVAMPRFWRFEVTGIFDTGMFQYDQQFVVMSLPVAQAFTGLGDAVSGLQVRVADPWHAGRVGTELEQALGYPYRALDWQTQNASLFSALQLEKLGMALVIFFIILVAASNIVATLTMTVSSKTREIGILQAMGLTRGGIRRVFLAQGAMIGLAGVALGLVLGLTVAQAFDGLIRIDPSVYFIDRLPVRVEVLDVGLVLLASFALALVVTIFPSSRAARLEPVEAIRWE
jgi:lipoprotein-releasing system permease protein